MPEPERDKGWGPSLDWELASLERLLTEDDTPVKILPDGSVVKMRNDTALQDGMLQWYLSQAPQSDVNVEKELDRAPLLGFHVPNK